MPETTQFGNDDGPLAGEGSLKANTVLMNRYKILGILGGGGQGAVYSGRDLNFVEAKRLVAIKEIRYPSGDQGVRSVAAGTFKREANILATLVHPAAPKVYDYFDQNNRAYIVMEYINGSDLELILSKTKELPMDKIIEWAIDLCDVLHYLHTRPEPIIFRDMKPANIMIDSLGKIRLIDFGIAKKFVSGIKNTMIGTEGYSAPEQYKGDVNPLSDIYSLGATLHHVITRKDPRLEPPFSFNERALATFNSKAPEALQTILDKALQMEPKDRFQSAEEMKEALLQLRYSPNALSVSGPNETGLFEDKEFQVSGAIEPRWTFKTEDEIRGSPIAHNNTVFVGSYDTNLWALQLEDGGFIWKFATNGGIATQPTIEPTQGLIYVGSEDQGLYAVNMATGREAWSHITKGPVRSSPTVAHDHVFFGSDDGRIYALVAANGRFLWDVDLGDAVRTRPYVTKDLIVVGAETGELVGITLSGSRKWGSDLSKRAKPIVSSPYVDEDDSICFVGSFDNYIYAVDISNGYTMWRFRTNGPVISSVILEGATIYFASTDGSVYALNSETAKERWRFTIDNEDPALRPIVATPVLHNGRLYVGGIDGNLYCLDAKNGKELWRFQTGGAITGAPFITDDLILVGSLDHTLYALPLVS